MKPIPIIISNYFSNYFQQIFLIIFTIHQIHYFKTLTTTLHFHKTTQLTHISQPTLSTQITKIKTLTNTPLF
ncbi:hypothetical protein DF186_22590, partial [Enterococcus hirae]